MRTYMQKKEEINRDWYVIDATDKTLGRLSTEVATLLRGKHKPTFTPHVDNGDYVIITNADKVNLTGKKWSDKLYYHHTGHPGGLTVRSAAELKERTPERIVELAVKGMLPKGKLGRRMFTKLFVYTTADHPHTAQNPKEYTLRG